MWVYASERPDIWTWAESINESTGITSELIERIQVVHRELTTGPEAREYPVSVIELYGFVNRTLNAAVVYTTVGIYGSTIHVQERLMKLTLQPKP